MHGDDRIGLRLRLKDLHTLHVVAELGSMAKASRQLGLSQPAISKAIVEMEHMLGATVLDRSARGVELTGAGRLLMARGRVVFDELREVMKDIRSALDPTCGAIRIGTTEPITGFLAEVIAQVAKTYPKITYDVAVSDTTTLVQSLRDRELDVVVTRWQTDNAPADLETRVLFNAPLAVLADKRHPLVGRKRLRLSDTLHEAWTLSPPDSYLGRVVVDLFRRQKLDIPAAVVTTLSIHMRLNLLAGGRFLTMLPARMVDQPAHKSWLRALDIDLPESAGPITCLTLRKRSPSGALKHFMKACQSAKPG